MKSNAIKVHSSKDDKKLHDIGFNTKPKKDTKAQTKLDSFLKKVPLTFPGLPKKQKIRIEKKVFELNSGDELKSSAFKSQEFDESYDIKITEEAKNSTNKTKNIENANYSFSTHKNELEDSDGFQTTKHLKDSVDSESDSTYKRKKSPDFVSVKKIKTQMPLGSNSELIIPQKKSPDKSRNYDLIENSKIESVTDLIKDSEGFITNKKKKFIIEADENLESKDYNFSKKYYPSDEPEFKAESPKFKTLTNKEKKKLKGYECERCKPFYEAFSDCMDPSALKNLCSEHRHQHPPSEIPDWYYKA